MHRCNGILVQQLETWLGNVLDVCVEFSKFDFFIGILHKCSAFRLYLLNLYNVASKVFYIQK